MTERTIFDLEPGPFSLNEDGLWCPSCGDIVIVAHQIDDYSEAPDECGQCGFPDDIKAMGDYHLND